MDFVYLHTRTSVKSGNGIDSMHNDLNFKVKNNVFKKSYDKLGILRTTDHMQKNSFCGYLSEYSNKIT